LLTISFLSCRHPHFPCSYGLDVDLKQSVNLEAFKDAASRRAAKKALGAVFKERYLSGKNKYFFQKLRF
jgi:large subunit ribosomal protein L27e